MKLYNNSTVSLNPDKRDFICLCNIAINCLKADWEYREADAFVSLEHIGINNRKELLDWYYYEKPSMRNVNYSHYDPLMIYVFQSPTVWEQRDNSKMFNIYINPIGKGVPINKIAFNDVFLHGDILTITFTQGDNLNDRYNMIPKYKKVIIL